MNSQRFLLLILVATVAAADRASAEVANLLINGGLESADAQQADRPAEFAPGRVGSSKAEMTWESPGYKSDRCVTVATENSSGLGYWQTVALVKPETTYTLTLHYKVRSTKPDGVLSEDPIYNQGRPGGPNLELGMLPDDSADAGKPTAWSDIGVALHPVGGLFLPLATEWSPFQHTFKTRPGQTKLVVKLRLWCYAQKVWFDKLSIVERAVASPVLPADPNWATRDTTPPALFRPQPPPNTRAVGDSQISVRFAEMGSGIDVGTAKILLDGADVTARAKVANNGLTWKTERPLAPGAHRVKVLVSDAAGNQSNTLTWQFGVDRTLTNKLVANLEATSLNGEPFFPIGIYAYACHPDDGRFREDHLTQAADAGYNIVLNTIERRKGLDKELAHGIMGTLNITPSLKHCTTPAAAKAAIFEKGQGRLADHPCIVAFWADDPENVENTKGTPISETALAKMRNARTALKQSFPEIPSIFAISNLPRLKPAMPYGDILLSYRYAVPQYHPMMIYGYTIAICRTMVPDKPLWFLSQAVDLGYGAKFKVPKPMRPTPAEVRAMAFYSLICDVKGYALYANTINAEDYPQHWATALDIAKHMRHISAPLAAGKDVRTAQVSKNPHAGSIFHREIVHDGRHTLIAVNMSAGAIPAKWVFAKPVKAIALFEDRAMEKAAGDVSDVFEPWGVHIYQW